MQLPPSGAWCSAWWQYLYFDTSKASKLAWSCDQAELAADGGHLVKQSSLSTLTSTSKACEASTLIEYLQLPPAELAAEGGHHARERHGARPHLLDRTARHLCMYCFTGTEVLTCITGTTVPVNDTALMRI